MTDHKPSAAELAQARFRKSSYSGGGGNECIEVASVGAAWAAVRDSKDTSRRPFVVRAETLTAFVDGVRRDTI